MMNINQLSNFERFAKNLIEGSLARFFRRDQDLQQVVFQIMKAVDSSEKDGFLANVYQIAVSSSHYLEVRASQEIIIINLLELLERYGQEIGKPFSGDISITFMDDDDLGRAEISIKSTHSVIPFDSTQQIPTIRKNPASNVIATREAFLIIGGKRHAPITQAVLNIGRHLDNDIVIESASVSRHHAQLKFRYGQFILHNLSRGIGTLVNDHQITESILKPGDVIDLGGIKLIFGEGADINGGRSKWNGEDGNTAPISTPVNS